MPSGKTLADMLEKFRGPEGTTMIDLLDAEQVQVTVDEMNKVWVNIDGRCVVRVGCATVVSYEPPGGRPAIINRKE